MNLTVTDSVVSTDYEEMTSPQESPTVNYSATMFEATRTLKCAWINSMQLANQLVTKTYKNGTNVNLVKGQILPNMTGDVSLVCDYVSIAPFGLGTGAAVSGGGSISSWDYAILTAHYSIFPDNSVAYLVHENYIPSMQFLTRPGRKLFWDATQTDQLGADEAPGILIAQGEWSYTIKQMPFVPDAINDLQGCINSSEMNSPTYNRKFKERTILYESAEIRDCLGIYGEPRFDITMKFHYNKTEWNLFYPAAGTTPKKIYGSDGEEYKPYAEANLNDILLTEGS